MKYTPQSEEELKTRALLAPGDYVMDVLKASDDVSKKSGNDMITLELQVRDQRGTKVLDWLVAADHERCLMKIRHFCRSADMLDKYESGELVAANCQGCVVLASVEIQDATKEYSAKNVIKDYLEYNGERPDKADIPEDDIPF